MVNSINIPETYSKIDELIGKEEHEQILKLSESIINISSSEKEAYHCKLISLIQLGRYEECVAFMEKENLKSDYPEEYCYALIEKKDYTTCEAFINNNLNTPNIELIKAQYFYKVGSYQNSFDILTNEINKEENMTNEDYLTNYLAVYFLSNQSTDLSNITKHMNSWESFFNYCLILLNQGKFGESLETLLRMQSFQIDDEFNELKYKNLQFSIIQTVFDGFDFSKTTFLQEEYSKLLKASDKNKDSSSKYKIFQPYFYNNFLHSKKEKDSLNETLKKLDVCLKNDFLTYEEVFVISINKIILLLRSNKLSEASKEFKSINKNFKSDLRYILVNCYIISKTEKFEVLEETIQKEYSSIPEVNLILLQTFLSAMTVKNIDAFHSKLLLFIQNFFSYAQNFHFINFFIAFYETKHLKQQLTEFISCFKNSEVFSKHNTKINSNSFGSFPDLDKTLYKTIGVTLYKCGLYQEAADFFNLILNENDSFCKESKIWLVNCLSHIDINKAEEVRSSIDNLKIDTGEDYISGLINNAFTRQTKDKTAVNEKVDKDLIKKNKKKKKKFVKQIDPSAPLPDPERWTPKWQRKKYKNTNKNKKNYQGANTDNTTTSSTFGVKGNKQ